MNQALAEWKLSIVYGSEGIRFKTTPDAERDEADGKRRYTYDLKFQEAFESRFLEVALVE